MRRQQFDQVCDAIRKGEHHSMEHQVTHRHGEVIGCQGDNFEVLTEDEKYQRWDRRNCSEDS